MSDSSNSFRTNVRKRKILNQRNRRNGTPHHRVNHHGDSDSERTRGRHPRISDRNRLDNRRSKRSRRNQHSSRSTEYGSRRRNKSRRRSRSGRSGDFSRSRNRNGTSRSRRRRSGTRGHHRYHRSTSGSESTFNRRSESDTADSLHHSVVRGPSQPRQRKVAPNKRYRRWKPTPNRKNAFPGRRTLAANTLRRRYRRRLKLRRMHRRVRREERIRALQLRYDVLLRGNPVPIAPIPGQPNEDE